MSRTPQHLDVDIDYIENLDWNNVEVTVYFNDTLLNGGYCFINGKIIYPNGDYDYYKIRVHRKSRAREYYRRINNMRCKK